VTGREAGVSVDDGEISTEDRRVVNVDQRHLNGSVADSRRYTYIAHTSPALNNS